MTHATKERLGLAAMVIIGLVLSAAAVWFWALSPLSSFEYFGRASDAEIIHHLWPVRLLQPEWFRNTPDMLLRWCGAEAIARLLFIPFVWFLLTMTLFICRYRRLRLGQT
jgi:hypothetical protein